MPSIARVAARAAVLRELSAFLWQRKLWWLLPMMAVLLVFGVLLLMAQGSAAAPFIYSLF
jgi:hypothetical protein